MKENKKQEELITEQEKYYANELNDEEKKIARKQAEHIIEIEKKGEKYKALAWHNVGVMTANLEKSGKFNKYWIYNFEAEIGGQYRLIKEQEDRR
jgi:hypothetical protein